MTVNLSPNQEIYKYRLVNRLGNGQFGQVWLANDLSLDTQVALKVLDETFQPVAQLLDEARIGNKFNHPNLLKILYADVAVIDDRAVTLIAQEYHPSGSLERQTNPLGFIPIPGVVKYLCDILTGLEHLHHQGFYHNDIKPSNILLNNNGYGVLADYGITAYSPDKLPVTPKGAYIVHRAPENRPEHSPISVTTDIYQVGVTAFRLINGIGLVTNEFRQLGTEEFEARKAIGQIPSKHDYLPFVPASVKKIVNTALNVDPHKRYQSALEMRRALERISFPGFWSAGDDGTLVGVGRKYHYWFTRTPQSGKTFKVECLKKNLDNQQETHVREFCKNKLTSREADGLISTFCDWVTNYAR